MFGLPAAIRACLFDLDGVLTRTATVHARAWKDMFDAFLRQRAGRTGETFTPFDPVLDYGRHVDGMPRLDGTRSFLTSRGITFPEGEPDDPPGSPTLHGLSNQENEQVLRLVAAGGVEVFDGSVRYVRAVRAAGIRTAVVSSSANTAEVLDAAAVFEDALAGVAAGRAGGFGLVVGVDRVGHADDLRASGADIVVDDLNELLEEDG